MFKIVFALLIGLHGYANDIIITDKQIWDYFEKLPDETQEKLTEEVFGSTTLNEDEIVAKLKEVTLENLRHLENNFDLDVELKNRVFFGVSFNSLVLYKMDFSNAILVGCSFHNMDLVEIKFKKSVLYICNFFKAKLFQADFEDSIAWYSQFSQATLIGANFTKADLRYADFTTSELMVANFTNSDVANANFTKASMRDSFRTTSLLGLSWENKLDLKWLKRNHATFAEQKQSQPTFKINYAP